MRTRPFVFSLFLTFLLLAWPCAGAEPVSLAANDEVIEADDFELVEPGGASLKPVTIPWANKVAIGRVPKHHFYDEDELEALKSRSRWAEDLGILLDPDAPFLKGGEGAPATKAPRVRESFEGLSALTAAHEGLQFMPPDTVVAASRSRVLEAANVGLRLTGRSGGGAQIQSLNNFFGEPYPPILFDPRVYYDVLSRRFYIVAVSLVEGTRTSSIHLAVSRGANPSTLVAPDDWCTYRVNAKRAGAWADFPTLGMNENWLAVSSNNFLFEGPFKRANLFVFDKRKLAENEDRCPSAPVWKYTAARDGSGELAFTVNPAKHYSPSGLPGTPLFLVSSQVGRFASPIYTLWRLTGAAGSKPRLSRRDLRVAALDDWYVLPPDAPQREGVSLDSGDHRISEVAYRNGKIWAVHATACSVGGAPNESCIRAVEITPNQQSGQLTNIQTFGDNGWYYWMPSIAINKRGDVAVPFQRGREGEYFGMALNGKKSARRTFDRVGTLRRGSCALGEIDSFGRNRTGDYVGIQTDPRDELGFWVAGEFPGQVGGSCDWRTWIARVRY